MVKYARQDRAVNLQKIIEESDVAKEYACIKKFLGERKHTRIIHSDNREIALEDGFLTDTLHDLREQYRQGKEVPIFFLPIFEKNEKDLSEKMQLIFYKKVEYLRKIVEKTGKSPSNKDNCKKMFPDRLGGGYVLTFFRDISLPERSKTRYTQEQIDKAIAMLLESNYFAKNTKKTKCNIQIIFEKNKKAA